MVPWNATISLCLRDWTFLYDVLSYHGHTTASTFTSSYFRTHCVFPVAARRNSRQPNIACIPGGTDSGRLNERGLSLCTRFARRDAQHNDGEHNPLSDMTNIGVDI